MTLKENQSNVLLTLRIDRDGTTVPLSVLQNARHIYIDYLWKKTNGTGTPASWPATGNNIVYGVKQFNDGTEDEPMLNTSTYLQYGFSPTEKVPADGRGFLEVEPIIIDTNGKVWSGRRQSIEVKPSLITHT